MQTSPYSDIIADKVTSWQSSIEKLEERAKTLSSDSQKNFNQKLMELKAAIETATIRLDDLDKNETVENTLETKNKILQVFDSIDRNFMQFEETSPFML